MAASLIAYMNLMHGKLKFILKKLDRSKISKDLCMDPFKRVTHQYQMCTRTVLLGYHRILVGYLKYKCKKVWFEKKNMINSFSYFELKD